MGAGGHILAGGDWWWLVVSIFWLVVGVAGLWWMEVNGGG